MDKKAIIKALRDTAQSASNAIASNVSGPVDLIAAGLRGVGLPIPQAPVGGSQWMAERGLTRDVEIGAPRIIGETLGMAGPTLAVAKAPQIAAGMNQMVENAMAPRTLNPQTGAIVWHGSPHKFDKFDASKIGTGEGAQAYGHGLYLAESPDVAKAYQESLSQENINALGRIFTPEELKKLPDAQRAAISAGSVQGVSGNLKRAQAMLDEGLDPKWVADFIRYSNELNSHPLGRQTTGQLYKVDLPDEQIAKMLDWDKPLSQQSKEVQAAWKATKKSLPPNAIEDLGGDLSILYGKEVTPGDFLGTMQSLGGKVNYGETLFKEQGIPGIRYLDGGSRGAGAGTSNFVVFPGNEHLLQILERNGQPMGLMGIK